MQIIKKDTLMDRIRQTQDIRPDASNSQIGTSMKYWLMTRIMLLRKEIRPKVICLLLRKRNLHKISTKYQFNVRGPGSSICRNM